MSQTMDQLVADIQLAVVEASRALTARRWGDAEKASRKMLSDVSKLHARLRTLRDVAEEAGYAAAEVDRALKRAEKHEQVTIEEHLAELDAARRRTTSPAKGKGKPRGKGA